MTAAVCNSTAGIAKVIETPAAGGPTWQPRPCEEGWWQTRQSREDLVSERLLGLFTDPGAGVARDKTRRRGLAKLLDWLQRQPGGTWQERWVASGADAAGSGWSELPFGHHHGLRH